MAHVLAYTMPVPLYQVDAFTDEPFSGNPAAVCVLDEPAPEAWMQQVAAEMNLSETAFLHPEKDGYNLRWFTPTTEVDLCGHATLASAHALWTEGHLDPQDAAAFHTKRGALACTFQDGWIAMDFPAMPPYEIEAPDGLEAATGHQPDWVGSSELDLLVLLEQAEAVAELDPDLAWVSDLPFRGMIVSAPAEEEAEADFVSRFFAPKVGVPEDPVTGSAHCALGPLWASRLGKEQVTGHQVSARGGLVRARPQAGRVELSGKAVTVLRGELADPT